MYGGLPLYYVVPMVLGPVLGVAGGWVTAWLQYRGQRASAVETARTQLTGDLRQELARHQTEIAALRQQMRVVRDVLLQMVEIVDDVSPAEIRDKLFDLIREGLRGV